MRTLSPIGSLVRRAVRPSSRLHHLGPFVAVSLTLVCLGSGACRPSVDPAPAPSVEVSTSRTAETPAPTLTVEPYLFETLPPDAHGNASGTESGAPSGERIQTVDAELGRFTVAARRGSADPDRSDDETLELAFVRFPSTAEQPGPPIVYLAGGPGGSGSGTARGSRFPLFERLRAVADVIAFDQRGTGLSDRPVDCPHRWSLPLDRAPSRADVQRAIDDAARRCAAFWRDAGVDLSIYQTETIADDLESLRRALGVPQIALWGTSYGSHLGLSAVRRHPDSISRIALLGIEGPDHTFKLPSSTDRVLDAADLAWAGRLPEGVVSLRAALENSIARLEREPIVQSLVDPETGDETAVTIGAHDLRELASQLLSGPSTHGYLIDTLAQLQAGDATGLAALVLTYQRGGALRAMPLATDAASGASPERLRRIARERETFLLGDAINIPLPGLAAALGVADLGPEFRAPLVSDVPALFVSGTLDGRTPVSNAEEVLEGLPNGRHFIVEGAGHGDDLFLLHPGVGDALERFFRGEAVESARLVP